MSRTYGLQSSESKLETTSITISGYIDCGLHIFGGSIFKFAQHYLKSFLPFEQFADSGQSTRITAL